MPAGMTERTARATATADSSASLRKGKRDGRIGWADKKGDVTAEGELWMTELSQGWFFGRKNFRGVDGVSTSGGENEYERTTLGKNGYGSGRIGVGGDVSFRR